MVSVADLRRLTGGSGGDDGRVWSNRLGRGRGRCEVLNGGEAGREERGVGHGRGDKTVRSVGTTSELVMEELEEFWLRTDASPSQNCNSLDPPTNGVTIPAKPPVS